MEMMYASLSGFGTFAWKYYKDTHAAYVALHLHLYVRTYVQLAIF
jgi:hypothetical protein